MFIDGQPVKTPTPKQVRSMGLAYVPEERMKYGSIGDFTVAENLILADYDQPPYARYGLLSLSSIETRGQQLVGDYSIRTPNTSTLTRKLSGGNIQKVVIAREFSGPAHPGHRHRRSRVHPRTAAHSAYAGQGHLVDQ